MKKLLPYLVLGGVALGLVALNMPATAKPQPQPSPLPLPLPGPGPAPSTDPTALLAQLNSLILAAAANPGSVDPAQVETLAAALDASGQPAAAAQARVLANQILLSRPAKKPKVAVGGWGGGWSNLFWY